MIEINFYNILNLRIYFDEERINYIKLAENNHNNIFKPKNNLPHIEYLLKYIENYYTKDDVFDVKYLDFKKLTDFQIKVYKTLMKIKKGDLISYSKLAEKSGFKGAARAVGTAMKKNPFPIIIPCHRVVSSKDIGGFSFGIEFKKQLLDKEYSNISIY